MPSIDYLSWIVVDYRGEHEPIQTFRLLRQQELARPEPNLAARLGDLGFDTVCALLALDRPAAARGHYGALLPSERMVRLCEDAWEGIKESLVREVGETGDGGNAVVRIGFLERLEELAGGGDYCGIHVVTGQT